MQRWCPFKPMRAACPAHMPKKFSAFRVYFLIVKLVELKFLKKKPKTSKSLFSA